MTTLRQTAKALGCDVSYLSKLIDRGVISRPATGDYSIEKAAIEWLTHLRQSAALKEERRAKSKGAAGVPDRMTKAREALAAEKVRGATARADGVALIAKAKAEADALQGRERARLVTAKAALKEVHLGLEYGEMITPRVFSHFLEEVFKDARAWLERHDPPKRKGSVAHHVLFGMLLYLRGCGQAIYWTQAARTEQPRMVPLPVSWIELQSMNMREWDRIGFDGIMDGGDSWLGNDDLFSADYNTKLHYLGGGDPFDKKYPPNLAYLSDDWTP